MWFGPANVLCFKYLGLYLGPSYLSVVPASWNKDFQLSLNCLNGYLWWFSLYHIYKQANTHTHTVLRATGKEHQYCSLYQCPLMPPHPHPRTRQDTNDFFPAEAHSQCRTAPSSTLSPSQGCTVAPVFTPFSLSPLRSPAAAFWVISWFQYLSTGLVSCGRMQCVCK